MKAIRLPESGDSIRDYMRYLRDLLIPVVNIEGDNRTCIVETRGGKKVISFVDAAGLALSQFAWGWVSVAGTTATLNGGYVLGFDSALDLHDTGREVSCGGTEAAPHLIVVQGTFAPFSGEILANSVAKSSFTGHSAAVWRFPLYTVFIRKGVVVMDRIHHIGCPINLKLVAGP